MRLVSAGLLILASGCAAVDPDVEENADPEWTDDELRAEIYALLELLDVTSRQNGGTTVANSLALDESVYPSWDNETRRELVADTILAEDNAQSCPTRGLAGGFWVPTAGPNGTFSLELYDGGDEPLATGQGTYQDDSTGPGESFGSWTDTLGRQGEVEGDYAVPGTTSVAAYDGRWVEGETGDNYGNAVGVWHPFRNQPGGLMMVAWTNCYELEAAAEEE